MLVFWALRSHYCNHDICLVSCHQTNLLKGQVTSRNSVSTRVQPLYVYIVPYIVPCIFYCHLQYGKALEDVINQMFHPVFGWLNTKLGAKKEVMPSLSWEIDTAKDLITEIHTWDQPCWADRRYTDSLKTDTIIIELNNQIIVL